MLGTSLHGITSKPTKDQFVDVNVFEALPEKHHIQLNGPMHKSN
jgi:hypothetical protein